MLEQKRISSRSSGSSRVWQYSRSTCPTQQSVSLRGSKCLPVFWRSRTLARASGAFSGLIPTRFCNLRFSTGSSRRITLSSPAPAVACPARLSGGPSSAFPRHRSTRTWTRSATPPSSSTSVRARLRTRAGCPSRSWTRSCSSLSVTWELHLPGAFNALGRCCRPILCLVLRLPVLLLQGACQQACADWCFRCLRFLGLFGQKERGGHASRGGQVAATLARLVGSAKRHPAEAHNCSSSHC